MIKKSAPVSISQVSSSKQARIPSSYAMELHGFWPLSKMMSPVNTSVISSSEEGFSSGTTHLPSVLRRTLPEAVMITSRPSGSMALSLTFSAVLSASCRITPPASRSTSLNAPPSAALARSAAPGDRAAQRHAASVRTVTDCTNLRIILIYPILSCECV